MAVDRELLAPPLRHALDLMGYANLTELCATLRNMSESDLRVALADEEFKDVFAVKVLVANAFRMIGLEEQDKLLAADAQ